MVRIILLVLGSYMAFGIACVLYFEKTAVRVCDETWQRWDPMWKRAFVIIMFVCVLIWPYILLGEVIEKLRKKEKESE